MSPQRHCAHAWPRSLMDESAAALRHFLAALAYRTQKALRGAPAGFAGFDAGAGVRTPAELVRHMSSVLGYARTFFIGGVYRADPLADLDAEVERLHAIIGDLAAHLKAGTPITGISQLQLLQGPFADAMTHAGQLALLRRLAGAPVASENFLLADISPDRLGSDQPAPAAPTPAWMGRLIHLAWKLSARMARPRGGAGAP